MNRQCNVTKRVQTRQGLRYCPVALAANGRVKPDAVLVNGVEERHLEGAYYIEWYEEGIRRRKSVGKHAADATARRMRKEAELNAVNQGVPVVPELVAAVRKTLAAAAADYLEKTGKKKKTTTLWSYSLALKYFLESCRKKNLDEIGGEDMDRFREYLEEKELSARTVSNKFNAALIFLRANGVSGIVKRGDKPRYTVEEVETYSREELNKFFKACDDEERVWFEFFLMTGERSQEVSHTYWSDIHFSDSVVSVTHKADLNWKPKAYKEREIPIPAKLVRRLKAWKKKSDGCDLVFHTSPGRIKQDFLQCCKAIAKRAGMKEDEWWLHKFRATFATWALWGDVDLRTVQLWLGHSDMKSTMRYLKPSRSKETRDKVNAIFS